MSDRDKNHDGVCPNPSSYYKSATFSGHSRHHNNVDNNDDIDDGTTLTTLQAQFATMLLTASSTCVSIHLNHQSTTPRYEAAVGQDDYITRACRPGDKMGLNTATSEEDARLETTLVPVSHAFIRHPSDRLVPGAPSIAAMAY
jgi:hypothetical protein